MPRPVCVPCQREMHVVKAVTVQFNAESVGGAYQQWQGDLAKCPGCGAEVVARWGLLASWEHHQGAAYFDKAPAVIVPEKPNSTPTPKPKTGKAKDV